MNGFFNQLDKITKRYIALLSMLIIAIGVLSVYTNLYKKDLLFTSEVVNLAGKQRVISQRISYLQYLVVTNYDAAQTQHWQSEMRLLLDEFENNHNVLTGRITHKNEYRIAQPKTLKALYANGPSSLNQQILTFLSLNRETSSALTNHNNVIYPPAQSTLLLAQLDNATKLHEQQGKIVAKKLDLLLLVIAGLLCITFYVFYLCISRPLTLCIKRQHQIHVNKLAAIRNDKQLLSDTVEQRNLCIDKVAHDIRNPVSAIVSILDIIANSKEDIASLLKQGDLACQRLLKYTDDLTDIINPSVHKGLQRDFSIIGLIDDCLAKNRNAAEHKNLSVTISCPNPLPEFVSGYPKIIRKCLDNVLDNAVTYTEEGTISVKVISRVKGHSVLLTVVIEDTGIGIPTEHLDTIFKRFQRISTDDILDHKLTGVGLAVSKEIIEQIGGSISVYSHTGHGSSFTLTFPMQISSLPPLQTGASKVGSSKKFAIVDNFEIGRMHLKYLVNKAGYECDLYASSIELLESKDKIVNYAALILDYHLPGLNADELTSTLHAMFAQNTPPVILVSSSPNDTSPLREGNMPVWQFFTKPIYENRFIDSLGQLVSNVNEAQIPLTGSILIVEDEQINAEMIVHMLHNMGFTTQVAATGETALTLAKTQVYDCILLDIHLPDISGLELIEEFKQHNIVAPIVVLSSDTAEETEYMAKQAGVRYYLAKPTPFQELKHTLQLTLLGSGS